MTSDHIAEENDFEMHVGSDHTLKFTVRAPIDQGGAILDITGAVFDWIMALGVGLAPVLTKQSPATITIIDAPNGRVDVPITNGESGPLAAERYYHELRMTSGGEKTLVGHGTGKLFPANQTA